MSTNSANENELEQKLRRIVEFAESMPEQYRMRCFDILIEKTIMSSLPNIKRQVLTEEESKSQPTKSTDSLSFQLPIDVQAFFQQYNMSSEDILGKLFFIQGSEIRPIFKLITTAKSRAQIHIALLTALENALRTEKFEFSFKQIRERCKERRCYGGKNFSKNFRNNSKFFNSLEDEEYVTLSPEGKSELADVILKMMNEKE
jgi:hypothetical protein